MSLLRPEVIRELELAKHGLHILQMDAASDIDDATQERISKLCKRVYRALSMSGYGRMDLRMTDNGEIYVIEVNPRASRTVPFVSKATGIPLARVAARALAGERLADMGLPEDPVVSP